MCMILPLYAHSDLGMSLGINVEACLKNLWEGGHVNGGFTKFV